MRLQVGHQRLPVLAPRRAVAQRVELQLNGVGQAQLAPQAGTEQNVLGVHVRAGDPKRLHADLVKLALAALLRPLVAKHRAGVPQSLGYVQQALLDGCPHATGRALGTQGQVLTVAVVEAVHLPLDDIGDLADGAAEQLGFLDQGQANLAIAVTGQQPTHSLLQSPPVWGLLRQDVVHPADSSYIAHAFSSDPVAQADDFRMSFSSCTARCCSSAAARCRITCSR